MKIVTTPALPNHEVCGVVTAAVSCLREHQFKFDQAILDELNEALERSAERMGGTAVVGVSYQLLMPTLGGYVQFQLTAIGTAIKA